MKTKFFFLLVLSYYSCKNEVVNYYPPIQADMSAGFYHKYKAKLDTAYLNEDQFEVGLELANLKVPIAQIFTS